MFRESLIGVIYVLAHGGMEAICWNLLEAGDPVISCINGIWGERFAMICDRQGSLRYSHLLFTFKSASK